jgi:hypothetical protein
MAGRLVSNKPLQSLVTLVTQAAVGMCKIAWTTTEDQQTSIISISSNTMPIKGAR